MHDAFDRFGDAITSLPQNPEDRGAAESAVDLAVGQFGGLDLLVNCTASWRAQPVHATDDDALDSSIDLILKPIFRYSRSALRIMADGACIIHIASVLGLRGNPSSSVLSASMSALIGLTRQMAADYGAGGIRVNAVAPGLIVTPTTENRAAASRSVRKLMIEATPSRRMGTPEDVAAAVAFLSSSDAGFINGHVLVVDGGWLATNYRPPAHLAEHERERDAGQI